MNTYSAVYMLWILHATFYTAFMNANLFCNLHAVHTTYTTYCTLNTTYIILHTIYEHLFCSLHAVNPTWYILHTLFYTPFMNANLFCNLHAVHTTYTTYCTLNTTHIILHSIYER